MIHVSLLAVDMRLPACRSLKEKRAVVKPIIESARRRFLVTAAEVDFQDLRGRAKLAFAVVSSSPAVADHVLDEVDRFIWSHVEIDSITSERYYFDDESHRELRPVRAGRLTPAPGIAGGYGLAGADGLAGGHGLAGGDGPLDADRGDGRPGP